MNESTLNGGFVNLPTTNRLFNTMISSTRAAVNFLPLSEIPVSVPGKRPVMLQLAV